MGDFRASIKIEMRLMGKDYKGDWGWVNYCANSDGVHHGVADWFRACWEDTKSRHAKALMDLDRERREEEERAMYERLKEKYDG